MSPMTPDHVTHIVVPLVIVEEERVSTEAGPQFTRFLYKTEMTYA